MNNKGSQLNVNAIPWILKKIIERNDKIEKDLHAMMQLTKEKEENEEENKDKDCN